MTAWSDFLGTGAEGLEGGKSSIFPRSVSLYDYQKTLLSDSNVPEKEKSEYRNLMIQPTDKKIPEKRSILNPKDDFEYLVNNFNSKNILA